MSRMLLIVLLSLSVPLAARADDPKPQWQRLLTGNDARKAWQIKKQLVALQAARKFPEAIRLREEYVALRTKVQGADHWQTIEEQWALVTARKYAALPAQKLTDWDARQKDQIEAERLEAQGKYAGALHLREQRLALCRQVLGEDHPATGTCYGNLAYVLHHLGKYGEALRLFQTALEIQRKTCGEGLPRTATAYNNLAGGLEAAGKYAEAAPLYEKALDIWRRVLGENNVNTAQGFHNVGHNLTHQGKFAAALPFYQKALDIRRKVLGEADPLTATTYGGIAFALDGQGKHAEAEPLLRKYLDICRKTLGENHPDTATAYNNLAVNLSAQGKYADAGPLDLKSLSIRLRVQGENHPQTATGYDNIALLLLKLRKYSEAKPLVLRALDIRRKTYGEEHPETARGYDSLAVVLIFQRKYAQAAPLARKALDIRRKVLGEDHPATAMSYDRVAYNLACQGRFREAALLHQKAVAIFRKALGNDHPELVLIYRGLAFDLHGQVKNAEALATLEQASCSYEAARLRVASAGLERAVFGAERSPYRFLAAARARAGRSADAWRALEYDLARGLLDETALRRGGLSPVEQRQRDTLRAKRVPLDRRVLTLMSHPSRTAPQAAELAQLHEQRQALERSLAELAAAASEREVASLAQVQAALPQDAAFVAWVDAVKSPVGLEEHWGCVVRPHGAPFWEPLPGSGPDGQWTPEDTKLPGQLRRALAPSAPPQEIEALAKRLYAQRLAPLRKHLRGVKRLFVTTLSGMPVEALTDEYTVCYTPSGTYLARLHERQRSHATRVLAVGDPVFPQARRAAESPRLPPGGLLITLVLPDTSAARARLQPGDVLIAYAGKNLTSIEQLDKLIAAKAGSKSAVVKVWREGQDKLTERELAPGPLGVVLANEPAREAILGSWQVINRAELPGTRVEVERLTGLFDPKTVTTLIRADASEQRLEELRKAGALKQFRYLHLATHGTANTVRSFDSALILSKPDQVPEPRVGEPWLDGRLTAAEVLEYWELDAELVTLSACESGLGRRGGGDGLLGFAQAFLLAGSRSVCLTLWQVDDTATVLLMDRFYRNLLGKREDGARPMGKAAALQEAKHWLRHLSVNQALKRLETLASGVLRGERPAREEMRPVPKPQHGAKDYKPYAHPRYWAAFVLFGDPE
jgi:tetratricopeptide (TPR) repeat protein